MTIGFAHGCAKMGTLRFCVIPTSDVAMSLPWLRRFRQRSPASWHEPKHHSAPGTRAYSPEAPHLPARVNRFCTRRHNVRNRSHASAVFSLGSRHEARLQPGPPAAWGEPAGVDPGTINQLLATYGSPRRDVAARAHYATISVLLSRQISAPGSNSGSPRDQRSFSRRAGAAVFALTSAADACGSSVEFAAFERSDRRLCLDTRAA